MTNPIAIRYPLDLTGISPNNLVRNEPHSLLTNPNRAIVPDYGPFYTDGLIITDQATNLPLVAHDQYTCCQLVADASLATGKEVMSVILIIDPAVSNNVKLTYQVLGGEYSYSTDALINLLATLQLDDRSVIWGQIIGTPNAFPPTPHLHDVGDTYGWEYVVDAIDNLTTAILSGGGGGDGGNTANLQQEIDDLTATVNGFNDALSAHEADHANPHVVTAAQVGLGNVGNFGIASQADVAAGTSNTLYVTPFAMAAALAGAGSGSALDAHIANHNNPHVVTAAQVGLGNVQNFGIATVQQAQDGVVNNVYMTPALVAAAIVQQAASGSSFTSHINNHSNPHVVTAAQLGLGNVQNYGLATQSDVLAGTANNLYVTPLANAVKASLNAAVSFTSILLGASSNIRFIEDGTTVGSLDIRTGVSGSYHTCTLDASGGFTITGQMVANGGFQYSDRRLKKDIEDFQSRPMWRSLSYKKFAWILSGKQSMSYIAQDVEEFFPEFLHEGNTKTEDGTKAYKAIDKASMALEMSDAAGRLIDAQASKIEELERRLAQLERRSTPLG